MINIVVKSQSGYRIDKGLVQSTVSNMLERFDVDGRVEIGVSFVDDKKMHEINRKFRGIDSTANILTFALEDPVHYNLVHIKGSGFMTSPDEVRLLGDIVISYPKAKEDALQNGNSVDEEIIYLIEHGVLHLLGKHEH